MCSSQSAVARTRSPVGTSCATSATTPTASSSGSGIGDYSDESSRYARAFADERGLTLLTCDLRDEYGFDVPTAASATRRVPCSACGLSKRHLFDKAARDNGYDVVATGHNLDDEAAVLFGNVLRWQTDYLGRQLPVLPARHGFPRKVKPLVRLSEREMAAYCVLAGIDYIVEECPMAAGNKHLGYKEALNQIEAQSPGSKLDFYFGFLKRASSRFVAEAEAEQRRPRAVRTVRRTDDGRVVRVLQARRTLERRRAGATADDRLMAGEFRAGDKVLLVDNKDRRYLITLTEGGEFHSHTGVHPARRHRRYARGHGVPVEPRVALRRLPAAAVRLRAEDAPRCAGHLSEGPWPAAVAGGHPSRACGCSSPASARARCRWPWSAPALTSSATSCARSSRSGPSRTCAASSATTRVGAYRVQLRNCYDGIDESELDRVVLDLPEPWQVVKHAERALRPGGLLVAYTPTIVQAVQLRETLESSRFALAETLEVLHRSWHIEGQSVRPDHRMVAHTGFLTAARLLADQS